MREFNMNVSKKQFEEVVCKLFKIKDFVLVGTWMFSKFNVVTIEDIKPAPDAKDRLLYGEMKRRQFGQLLDTIISEKIYIQLFKLDKNYVVIGRQPIDPKDTMLSSSAGTGFITWKNLSEAYLELKVMSNKKMFDTQAALSSTLEDLDTRSKRFYKDSIFPVFKRSIGVEDSEKAEKALVEIEEYITSSFNDELLGSFGFNYQNRADIYLRIFPIFHGDTIILNRVIALAHTSCLDCKVDVRQFKIQK